MDESEDWALDFSKYNFDFVKRLSDFRVTKRFCDATFLIGGKRFCFHRAILAASSTYFSDILKETCESDHKVNGHEIILVENQLEEDVAGLLMYIYATGDNGMFYNQYSMSVTQCSPKLMKQLNRMRHRGEFCDVVLKLNDEIFYAHRVVLAAGSPYFYSLFTSNMKEREKAVVEIIIPELSVAQDLLNYMYTGSVRISDLNAIELWIAADYLFLDELKLRCYLFLESTLSVSNCLSVLSFAKYYGLDNLQNITRQFTEQNFTAVAKSEGFLELSAAELEELVPSDALNVTGEEIVYESLMTWCKHNISERKNEFERLFLDNIRLSLIDSKYVRRNLLRDELIVSNEKCINKVRDVLLESMPREEPRLGYSSFYMFSLQRDCRNNELQFVCYDIQHGACVELEPPLDTHVCTEKVELASCYGRVYAVDAKGCTSCFDPQSNRWSQMPSIPDVVPSIFSPTRWGHGLASLDGFLYVSGGNMTLGEPDGLTLRYDCKANAWEMAASLSYPRCGTCVVSSACHIYAIGGEDQSLHSCKTVERYNPCDDTWAVVSPMTTAKGERPKGVAARDKIFVCMENICELHGCEIYNTTTDQWQIVTSPRAHKLNPPLGSDGSKVYVLGGRACIKHSLSNLTRLYSIMKVQVLDVSLNQWRHQGAVFTTGSPINSCLMQVHRKLGHSGQNSCCIL